MTRRNTLGGAARMRRWPPPARRSQTPGAGGPTVARARWITIMDVARVTAPRSAVGPVREHLMLHLVAVRAGEVLAVVVIAGGVLAAAAAAGVWWVQRRLRRRLQYAGRAMA